MGGRPSKSKPPPSPPTIVLLGAGVSSGYFAQELALLGVPSARLILIGDEASLPYERPALSKGYLMPPGTVGKSAARLPGFYTPVGTGKPAQGPEWYAERGYETLLGRKIVRVDLGRKEVHTQDVNSGEEGKVGFDKLVVALGQKVRTIQCPGADAEGVFYLKSEAQAGRIVERLTCIFGGEAKPNVHWKPTQTGIKRCVVVGSSYLAVETATMMCGWGFDEVCIAMLGAQLMTRSPWNRELRKKFEDEVSKRSPKLKLLREVSVENFVSGPDGEVRKIIVDDGGDGKGPSLKEYDCDLVIVCIGSVPEAAKTLFQNALMFDRQGAIKTSPQFVTSHSSGDIYAIGEVARSDFGVDGTRRMAAQAARVIHAEITHKKLSESELAFTIKPFHYSRLYEWNDTPFKWESCGKMDASADTRLEMFGGDSVPFGAFWVNKATSKVTSCLIVADSKGTDALFKEVRRAAEEEIDLVLAKSNISGFFA